MKALGLAITIYRSSKVPYIEYDLKINHFWDRSFGWFEAKEVFFRTLTVGPLFKFKWFL